MWFLGRKNKKGLPLRWNQIRLSHLLIAMLVISVGFWVVRQRIESYERKKAVQELDRFARTEFRGQSRGAWINAILGDDGRAGSLTKIGSNYLLEEGESGLFRLVRHFPSLESLQWDNGLTTDEVLHIDDAKNLRDLDLTSFDFRCEEVKAISRLKRLESLSLTSCVFQDGCFSQLDGLIALKHLTLDHPHGIRVSDLKVCESFGDLESITIVRCDFTGSGLLDWRSLRSLASVSIRECVIPDELTDAIATAPNLQSLQLGSSVFNAEKLQLSKKSTTLKKLSLQPSRSYDNSFWESIAQLEQLEELTLAWTYIDTRCLQLLSGSKSIRKLTLTYTSAIDPTVLSQFHHLSELRLYGTLFDSAFVGQLKNLPSLRRFHLGWNNLRLDDVKLLLRTMPQITYLDLFPQKQISQEMVQSLREEFPHVEIVDSRPWLAPSMH